MEQQKIYQQGYRIDAEQAGFAEALGAAVDYRGDVTLELKNGQRHMGFLFTVHQDCLYLYPQESPDKLTIPLADVKSLEFSGVDKAAGKSWEEYQARKKQKQQAAPQQPAS